MSTQSKPTVVECNGPTCHATGNKWQFHHGKFCSNECEARSRGREALSGLKHDHTRCFSCMAELKEIEDPKGEYEFKASGAELTYNPDDDRVEVQRYGQDVTRQAACGYQYRTQYADIDVKTIDPLTITGTICGNCGATDHRHHIHYLANGHETAQFVVDYLNDLEDEDAIDFDETVLHRVYALEGDIEWAAGAAIMEAS